MEKALAFGLALGMLTGALIVANSRKVRNMVTTGQEEVLDRMEQLTQKAAANKKNRAKQAQN